jgi:hypothetical protein
MAIRGVGNRDGQGVEELDLFLSALTRGTDEDKAVMMSAEDTVALVTTNNQFIGVARVIDQKNADISVQTEGWAEILYDGSAPSPEYGYHYLVGGATAGKVKVATEGEIKAVAITVSTGQTAGSSAADPTLVGAAVVGLANDTNQDQLVDNVAIAGDGAITVTLAAAATADNKFKVNVLKKAAFRPKKYLIGSTDTTNTKVMVFLG